MTFYILKKDELYHHGIKGMKWGRRRYRNADGSLTPAGKKRYGDDSDQKAEKRKKVGKALAIAGASAAAVGAGVAGAVGAAELAKRDKQAAERRKENAQRRFDESHDDYKRVHKKLDTSKLSDKELQQINNRFENEKKYEQFTAGMKEKSKLETTSDVLKTSSDLVNGVSKAVKAMPQPGKKPTVSRQDLDSMSDQELRSRINRIELERRYTDLTAQPATVSKGRQAVETTLAVVGGTLAAAGSVVTIIQGIQKIRGKG